jgi:hypothetical protein
MEDTNQNIITNATPSILDIKPVENLEKVVNVEPVKEEPIEMEDLKDDDIFLKPQKTKKKKREISERQKAHMKKMNEIRRQKAQQRKAEKAKNQPKPQPKLPPKTEARPQRKEEPVDAINGAGFSGHQGNMSNQEYMQQFFSNMNMFMDSYNKLNTLKKHQTQPKQIPKKDHFQDMKPQKKQQQKPKPKPTPQKPDTSYYIDFLKPNVNYNNYKNPFGF